MWPVGPWVAGEMADGANKGCPALGIWRLVCSGCVARTGQEGPEHAGTSGFTSSVKVERLALNLWHPSCFCLLVLGLQAYITTSYPDPLGKKKDVKAEGLQSLLESCPWLSGPPSMTLSLVASCRQVGKLAFSAVD